MPRCAFGSFYIDLRRSISNFSSPVSFQGVFLDGVSPSIARRRPTYCRTVETSAQKKSHLTPFFSTLKKQKVAEVQLKRRKKKKQTPKDRCQGLIFIDSAAQPTCSKSLLPRFRFDISSISKALRREQLQSNRASGGEVDVPPPPPPYRRKNINPEDQLFQSSKMQR